MRLVASILAASLGLTAAVAHAQAVRTERSLSLALASQIATALTTLGITPPEMDVWDWALAAGKHEITGEPVAD